MLALTFLARAVSAVDPPARLPFSSLFSFFSAWLIHLLGYYQQSLYTEQYAANWLAGKPAGCCPTRPGICGEYVLAPLRERFPLASITVIVVSGVYIKARFIVVLHKTRLNCAFFSVPLCNAI
jgi:hypothetical protein